MLPARCQLLSWQLCTETAGLHPQRSIKTVTFPGRWKKMILISYKVIGKSAPWQRNRAVTAKAPPQSRWFDRHWQSPSAVSRPARLSPRQWNYHKDLGNGPFAGLDSDFPATLIHSNIGKPPQSPDFIGFKNQELQNQGRISQPGIQVLSYSSSNQNFLMCNNNSSRPVLSAHYVLGNILRVFLKK